ncbi:MAG: acyl transferase [Flavobacteriia bacterium]|nr:acyl transferase [Flavobacteriia bacterium]
MNSLEKKIFSVKESNFEPLALEIFDFQYNNCEIYRKYVDLINKKTPTSLDEIPFLPISFFKSHLVNTKNSFEVEFISSGTKNSIRSKHQVYKKSLYIKSFETHYRKCIGNPEEHFIFALLPNYVEQGQSSLVYMVNHLISLSNQRYSGFYMNDSSLLIDRIKEISSTEKKIILFGVSYALLDLAIKKPDFSKVFIIETGGMKGRRKEMSKSALHSFLKKHFQTKCIASEYGMTEILSQSYSFEDEFFISPPWKRVLIRDVNDPFHFLEERKTGAINVIDLANLYSCSFIETEDLGKKINDKFQVLGRMDSSELRGCNLLYFDKL